MWSRPPCHCIFDKWRYYHPPSRSSSARLSSISSMPPLASSDLMYSSPSCRLDHVSPPSSESPSPPPLYLQSVPSLSHWEDGFFDYLSKIDCSAVTISSVAQGSIIFPRVPLIVSGPRLQQMQLRYSLGLESTIYHQLSPHVPSTLSMKVLRRD